MEKSLPAPASIFCRSKSRPTSLAGDVNLILVSRSSAWFAAVEGATRTLGRGDVTTCGARDALARLAGTASHYSHLLVDTNDADGLFNELADITVEVRAPCTNMLLLGAADSRHPSIPAIATATAQSVLEALLASPIRDERPLIDLAELRAALRGAMIETRYQPIVRVFDRRPIGLEALVRLNHPDKGTLLPDLFVPQIEDAGLAAELTRLVSARAFADLTSPFLAGHGLRMAINVPLDVMLTDKALDQLEEQRQQAGIHPTGIVIELTESRPVDDASILRQPIERLRSLGYGIAIDDVGPAVPRLLPLLELPFTSLKLDKDLVQQVDTSDEVRAFLADTTNRAKAKGLTVVAEGVETEETWSHIAALGVDEIQGYLAARPLSVAAVPVWWTAWMDKHALSA